MAKETNGFGKTIEAWSAAQAKVEEASKALAEARAETAKCARAIYDELGTQPFTVKALGGVGYRAMHKPARVGKDGRNIPEQYHVLPLPDFTPQRNF